MKWSGFLFLSLGICILILETVEGRGISKGSMKKGSDSKGGNPFSLSSAMKASKSRSKKKPTLTNPFSLTKPKTQQKKSSKTRQSKKPCPHCLHASVNLQLHSKSAPDDSKCEYLNCLSCRLRYRTCPVFSAGTIISAEPVYIYRESTCRLDKEYGFKGRDLWVTNGCRAKFRVCYKKGGLYKNLSCQCDVNGGGRTCGMGLTRHQHVTDVVVLAQYSPKRCLKNKTYGFSEQKNNMWVKNGCGAMFRIYIRS